VRAATRDNNNPDNRNNNIGFRLAQSARKNVTLNRAFTLSRDVHGCSGSGAGVHEFASRPRRDADAE